MPVSSTTNASALQPEPGRFGRRIDHAVAEIGKVLLGKEEQVRLALCCLIAGGHLLLEDRPGMGKTTLSQALARVFGLACKRIQFTSDLLPADIVGVSVFEQETGGFVFHPGPVFSNVVLADEINRTTPKTQSALLEAMEERQVTVDGETRRLPSPFFVIATQNPLTFAGTFPLPESQLDRFMMCLAIGYPDAEAERLLLAGDDPRTRLREVTQCLSPVDIATAQNGLAQVSASDTLLDYVQRLVLRTRDPARYAWGLSPRGALALMRAARAWALMQDRDHLLPEDIQQVLPAVVDHRLRGASEQGGEVPARRLLAEIDIFTD